MVVAGCFSDCGDSIHDREVAVKPCTFVSASTIGARVVRRDSGAIRYTRRCHRTVNLSPEYVDASSANTLEDIVIEVVETISHLEVVRTPLAHRLRNIRVKCLP